MSDRIYMSSPDVGALEEQYVVAAIRSGEVLILDMVEPVRVLGIVERMIRESGRGIGTTFTGLRDGEKLHEVLMGEGELDKRPKHSKISHVTVSPLEPDNLDAARWSVEAARGA